VTGHVLDRDGVPEGFRTSLELNGGFVRVHPLVLAHLLDLRVAMVACRGRVEPAPAPDRPYRHPRTSSLSESKPVFSALSYLGNIAQHMQSLASGRERFVTACMLAYREFGMMYRYNVDDEGERWVKAMQEFP
jgi:hypothetical protein